MNKNKLFCSSCNANTWHEQLFEKIYREPNQSDDYQNCGRSVVAQCCGCEQPYYYWSSWTEDNAGKDVDCFKEWVFPPKPLHKEPSWHIDFTFSSVFSKVLGEEDTTHISRLLGEVHTALSQDCPRLGIMGVRAIFEHIMISKIGDNGSFKKNINKFQDAGYISTIQRESIEHILEAGHAAIHRSHVPDIGELIAALQIVEGLIEVLYINPDRSKWISKNVKSR